MGAILYSKGFPGALGSTPALDFACEEPFLLIAEIVYKILKYLFYLVRRLLHFSFKKQCVCCFVLLNRYWGIVTVPGSIPYGSRPGVAGSSPFTLTTSLAIPVPSSSSSNGPSNYSVDNHGLVHGLPRLGRSKVRACH